MSVVDCGHFRGRRTVDDARRWRARIAKMGTGTDVRHGKRGVTLGERRPAWHRPCAASRPQHGNVKQNLFFAFISTTRSALPIAGSGVLLLSRTLIESREK